jgi:hypothetical protein
VTCVTVDVQCPFTQTFLLLFLLLHHHDHHHQQQHYSPLSLILASVMTSAHSVQSACCHLFTSLFLKSNPASSIHFNQGLPFFLLPPGLPSSNFCTVLAPSIPTTCTSHSNLCNLIMATISGDLNLL